MKLWDTPTCLMQRQCLAPNKEGFVPYHARQCGMWDVLEHLKTRIPVPPCKSPPLRCVCLGYTFVSTCFTSFHLQPFTFVMFPQLELVASVFPSAIHVFFSCFCLSLLFSHVFPLSTPRFRVQPLVSPLCCLCESQLPFAPFPQGFPKRLG